MIKELNVSDEVQRFQVCGHNVPLDNLAIYTNERSLFISCDDRKSIVIALKENGRTSLKVVCNFDALFNLLNDKLNWP